jgi:hypothetical protein
MEFTVDESQIATSVQLFPIHTGSLSGSGHRLFRPKPKLILLLQLLSTVSNDFARGNTFNSLLRIFHKYPLLEDDYSESDELSPLYQEVITAAETYLGTYSRVSVRYYTRILLIQIPNCR